MKMVIVAEPQGGFGMSILENTQSLTGWGPGQPDPASELDQLEVGPAVSECLERMTSKSPFQSMIHKLLTCSKLWQGVCVFAQNVYDETNSLSILFNFFCYLIHCI